jgi:CHAT domain-containing protein/Flp pilus assembly protein TadD
MPRLLLRSLFLLLFLASIPAAARQADQSQATEPFKIQADQSVYVVAHRISGEPDLYLEGRLKQVFEKEKVFKPVRRPSEAAIVFLVYSEYKIVQTGHAFDRRESSEFLVSASGFALLPEDYTDAKGNLDALRDRAIWYEQATVGRMYRIPENLSGKLLKKFHEDVKAPAGIKKSEPASGAASGPRPPAPGQLGAESRREPEPRAVTKLPSSAPPPVPPDRDPPRDAKAAARLEDESDKSLAKGEFARALAQAESVLEFREKQLGAEHIELAWTLNRSARASLALGDYNRAETSLRRGLKIAEQPGAAAGPRLAELLGTYASLHLERGDLAQAETSLRRAVALLEKSAGPEDLKLVALLDRLAVVESEKGDYAQAEQLLHRALIIQEKKLGENHPELAPTIYNLASLYFIKDNYLHAEPLYTKVLDIIDGKHRTLSKYLDPIARIYANRNVSSSRSSSPSSSSSNERNDAEQSYESYRWLTAFLFQKNTPVIADALSDLALIRIHQGKLLQAEQMLGRALQIRETAFGSKHPQVARIHERFAMLHRSSGEIWKAMASQRLASEIAEINLRRNLVNGSERQKLAYLSRFAAQTDFALSLHWFNAPNDPEMAKKAITVLLRHKGRGLDAMSDALAGLRSSNDPQSRALLDRFSAVRAELSTLALNGNDTEAHRRRLAAFEDEIEAIEAEIGARSVAFRAERSAITYETVQAALPVGTALVEFARYQPVDGRMKRDGVPRYVAYVIFPKGQPRSVELGDAVEMDRAVADLRDALRDKSNAEVKSAARYLDGMLMQPVRKLLGETRQVLVSPDGAINLLPFAALVDERNRYLVERYQFTYLSSGRDLLRLHNRPPAARGSGQEAMIFADPDFGAPVTVVPAGANRPLTLAGAVFTPLPATADEAREIAARLPNAATFVQAEATEAAIKRVHAPAILHIATHGFFLEDETLESSPASDGRLLKQPGPARRDGKLENPLLRSGLGLAGANLRRSGQDDGILTAFETSALDLWGTKLVVLSACDTGVGVVKNGDGVYGLRRALALAGAETLVMSLWPVSDKGTSELMIAYYKALQAGQGRGEAMQQVQLQMLGDPKRRHPYYWASFIVSGEWANLDGNR